VFSKDDSADTPIDLKTLHAQIGQLTLENDFLGGAPNKVGLLSAGKRDIKLRSDD